MDWGVLSDTVVRLGFPIVMCGAMAWYVKYITDKHREDLTNREEQHRTEMDKMSEAINNNTLALTKLCERMEKEG